MRECIQSVQPVGSGTQVSQYERDKRVTDFEQRRDLNQLKLKKQLITRSDVGAIFKAGVNDDINRIFN